MSFSIGYKPGTSNSLQWVRVINNVNFISFTASVLQNCIIYGKSRLVKSDGGLVNIYNCICNTGGQAGMNVNGEPEENDEPETTLASDPRVYLLS